MARDEASVKVRLKTRQAKSDLRGLMTEAKGTAGAIGGSLRSTVGRGLGVIGLGVGIGAAISAVRGPTESGIGALASQLFGGFGATGARNVFGNLPGEARASIRASAEITRAEGHIAGIRGKTLPGMMDRFEQLRELYMPQEVGKDMVSRELSIEMTKTMVKPILRSMGNMFAKWLGELAALLEKRNK